MTKAPDIFSRFFEFLLWIDTDYVTEKIWPARLTDHNLFKDIQIV